MAYNYDDYRPSSSLTHTADGKEVSRTIYVRAANEIAASQDAEVPARGDAIDVGDGSISEYLYVSDVEFSQVEGAAGDDSEDFLFEVTITYKPLTTGSGTTPVVNKATWKVTFSPAQIQILNVDEDDDQEHYTPGSGAEVWDPVTTGINETLEGPQGVTIDEMVEKLVIEFWKDPDDIEDYLADVRSIVNRTNEADFDGPWGSYEAGEAKITGLEVAKQSDEIVSVSVEISRSANDDSIPVQLDNADALVNVSKDGWQYMWVRWIKSTSPDDPEKVVKPRRIDAHVATVYKSGDFDKLGVTEDIFV